MKSLFEVLTAPIHFTVTQSGQKRSLHFRLYPIVLLLIVSLLFIIISVGMITMLASEKQALYSQRIQISSLQKQQQQLIKKSAEAEAALSLRDAQIEAMRQEQQLLRQEKSVMQKRLDMFDEVLAARKKKGLHMLRPTAYWQEGGLISYNLILVKGANFPRWQKGELTFSVINQQQEEVPLLHKSGKLKYKFDMTTQEFVAGALKWNRDWQPDTLMMTIHDLTHHRTTRHAIRILKHAVAEPASTGGVQ